MSREINKVAVLGAGTMGSRIAAHFANIGLDCLLLDVPIDNAQGVSRNGRAQESLKGLQKSHIPAFFTTGGARRVEIGNFVDDISRLDGVDWTVEAIVENFEAKKDLLSRVDKYRRKGSLVTTNTSGLPVANLSRGFSEDFQRHWLGTHFFNPPRQMRLVEIVETPKTDPEVTRFVSRFCDERLGKVVVPAKDCPNFIANRLFLFSVMHVIKTMVEQGLTIEEVDMLTGTLIGRSRMATFCLADFTGIDVCLSVASNLYDLIPEDEQRNVYKPPGFLCEMLNRGFIGDKAGAGFYKKDRRVPGGRLVLELDSLEYRRECRPDWPILEEAKAIVDVGERIKFLFRSDSKAGVFLNETLRELLVYAAARIPEISDSISDVDVAMRDGFNWHMGPFELWDVLGIEEISKQTTAKGDTLPALVNTVLGLPVQSFYAENKTSRAAFSIISGDHQIINERPGVLSVASVRRRGNIPRSNEDASLLDLGDGVACLEFHSKANSLNERVFEMIAKSVEEVESNYEALVIGNEGKYFSGGADLKMLLSLSREKKWNDIERAVRWAQELFRSLRDCSKPTVAAIFGKTLSGGCEIAMHCDHVQAVAETYMGLVEVSVGLIPAGGGCKELLRRSTEMLGVQDPILHPSKRVFETIGTAKISGSAVEAKQLNFLRTNDSITMNSDRLLSDAKQAVLSLVATGYRRQRPSEIFVGGRETRAALEMVSYLTREAEWISDYDYHISKKLAFVVAGGDLSQPSFVSEEYMLGLEKEAFVSLCGEEKTQQRMEAILKTGKPLRN